MAYVSLDDENLEVKKGKLDLSSRNIKDITEIKGLKNFSDIQVLYFNKNEIREIKGLETLKNLRILDLSDNLINEIKGLKFLSKLQWLVLRNNKITEIKELNYLRNLKILNLQHNEITEINGLETLTNLQELILNDNKITEIKGLEYSTNLQELDIINNQITTIKGLDLLTNLERLSLNKNQISKIIGLENLINLRELSLAGNQITHINNLESLTKLRVLNLSNNQIIDIKGLESLVGLKFLNLKDNQIPAKLIKNLGGLNQKGIANNPQTFVEYCQKRLEAKREEKERKRANAIHYIKKLPKIYSEITFEKIMSKTGINLEELEHLIETMIFNKEINAQISGTKLIFKRKEEKPFSRSEKVTQIPLTISEYRSRNIEISRGGDWKIEGNQSVFHYKVKIKNLSQYIISDIQIIFGDVPQGLELRTEKLIEFSKLSPYNVVSPTYKLYATDNCVGSEIKGIVNYSDHFGKTYTVKIEPFEIHYVCNLLIPKRISREEFDRKIQFMRGRTMIIDSSLNPDELKTIVKKNIEECNFALLQEIRDAQKEGFMRIEGLAQGLYDKQDVAISVAMRRLEAGSELKIKTLSDEYAKTTDLMRDISIKLEDIKSDTQKIEDIIYYIDESKIRETIGIIIQNPKDLKRVIYKVIKNPEWSDEEKNKWAKIVMETLNYYKVFKPPLWLKFVQKITKITLGESASKAITNGVEQLVNWINGKVVKKKMKEMN
ncbi:MAG: leucine-rich repeat domain-containing protein [Promethearchaeota archaeon]